VALRARKTVRVGPLRFSISKSGIGVSTGIKGVRVGTGPRGHYVSVGRDGVYYKKSFGKGLPKIFKRGKDEAKDKDGAGVPLDEIESGSVLDMTDSSSAVLLDEINETQQKRSLWPFGLLGGLVLVGAAALSGIVWLIAVAILVGAGVTVAAYLRDRMTKTVVLMYDLDPDTEAQYEAVQNAFDEMVSCDAAWHVKAVEAIDNAEKDEDGYPSLDKSAIRLTTADPPFVQTNLEAPRIPVGRQTLHFQPDRLYVFESKTVGAVPYSDLRIEIEPMELKETGPAPRDAEVVGKTYKHARKDGKPDKRFKDNPEIPIVVYETVHFASETGLNECIQLSRKGAGEAFRSAIAALAEAGKSTEPWVER